MVAAAAVDRNGDPLAANDRRLAIETAKDIKDELGGQIGAEKGRAGDSLIEVVDDPTRANWWFGPIKQGSEDLFILSPTDSVQDLKMKIGDQPLYGPAPRANRGVWLKERFERIARAQNLLAIAGAEVANPDRNAKGMNIGLEVVRYRDKTDKVGTPIDWKVPEITIHCGEYIGFRVENLSREPYDVTLLSVNDDYGIVSFFPGKKLVTNRLNPLSKLDEITTRVVNDGSEGKEHLVLIAVKAEKSGSLLDFSFLEQPSLERAREVAATRGAESAALDSPLGRLFQDRIYARSRGTRGERPKFDSYAIHLLTFRTEKK